MQGIDNQQKTNKIIVQADEEGMRLDRWLRKKYPMVRSPHILIRTGQVRINSKRAKADARVKEGDEVRLPPNLGQKDLLKSPDVTPKEPILSKKDKSFIRSLVIYEDAHIFVLNKLPGLATQGGTKISQHVDRLSYGLMGETCPEKPKIVHRLDKETSGVLILAKTRSSAAWLTEAFREHKIKKMYWALVKGVPASREGTLRSNIEKVGQLYQNNHDPLTPGREAITHYRLLRKVNRAFSWIELLPLTGRTHQLRVHCEMLGTPIVGDDKYGAFKSKGAASDFPSGLHLHAIEIAVPQVDGSVKHIRAPLPAHMQETWEKFGWQPEEREE